LLSDDDFDSVKVESWSVTAIEKFIDAESIDPVYYDTAYYRAPDGDAGRDVYAVLREANAKTDKPPLPASRLHNASERSPSGRWAMG
jgi:DNA end-binding protein Ku